MLDLPRAASSLALWLLVAPAVAADSPSQALLRVVDAFQGEDVSAARRAQGALESLGRDRPEARAGRGLVLYLEQDFAGALAALSAVEPRLDPTGAARLARARAAFFLGRVDEARAALGPTLTGSGEEARGDARLQTLLDGPFRARWPLAADALEAPTPEGHYRVVSDVGLSDAELARLEKKLSQAAPAQRQKLLEQARRKHPGLARLAWLLERAHAAFGRLFPAEEQAAGLVPSVYVLRDRRGFDDFSRQLGAGAGESTLGYYVPSLRVLVFYDQSRGERPGELDPETRTTLLHETFHHWLHIYAPGAPRWFDEGLAEYFGISQVTAKEYRYGLLPTTHPSRLDNIREALSGALPEPMRLDALLQADHETFMVRAAVNYAQSWSFVHFLGSSPGGQKLLRAYFQTLRRAGPEVAFREVFAPLDLRALEAEWKAYVARLK